MPLLPDAARAVEGGLRFRDVSDNCGTTAAGALYCWNIAVDTTEYLPSAAINPRCEYRSKFTTYYPCATDPVQLAPNGTSLRVAARSQLCGMDATGVPACWGGALASITGAKASPVPYASGLRATRVSFPATFAAVFTAGGGNVCGRTADGAVYCRGSGSFGLYGNGNADDDASSAALVAGGMRFVSADASSFTMCGVDAAGAAWCWGADNGSVGAGSLSTDVCSGSAACATRPRRVASIAGLQ